jgi:DNA repair exonuclease SbcCD ATPase subunit
LEEQSQQLSAKIESCQEKVEAADRARQVALSVLSGIQEQITAYASALVSRLVRHVFGEEYEFRLVPKVERGRPGLAPMFLVHGQEVSPREEVGGGLLDVASLGMRLAHWRLMKERTSPIFLLDEPGRFLDAARAPKLGEILATISNDLGVQIIYITHNEVLAEIAETAYQVQLDGNGVSQVIPIKFYLDNPQAKAPQSTVAQTGEAPSKSKRARRTRV